MAMLPSSSSSSANKHDHDHDHDVFSFRGTDTRYGFIGNLYKALCDRGFQTFIDDEELHKGDQITPSLLKAIEHSRIAIIVLSQNYASSSFCLDELSKIIDCIDEKGQLVWPVFYDVDPCDVRHLRGAYGEAISKHEERFKDNLDKLQKWRMALQQVASLSGWHFKHEDGYEYEFIGKILEEVSRNIKCAALLVADNPVGLESQVLNLNSLLEVGFDDRVHMIGIHGPGGIGKTTLNLAVYNSIAHHFEGSCFLENVREDSDRHGLLHLQKTLLSKIIGTSNIELTSVKEGSSIIQHRLRQKKVLLILDDVDKREQLEAIVGRPEWFGSGSRVIITTRDQHLLTRHGVERKYEVWGLDRKDALKLLRWKAFKTDKVNPSYADILDRAVIYASGLPLALEVIGSNVEELVLYRCEFTIVPVCIKECRLLRELTMDYCEQLQEIRELPPNLKTFSAQNCTSLTSSSRRKLMNQEVHEAGNTFFCVPSLEAGRLPKWFEHQIRLVISSLTTSFSFYFRNNLPDNMLLCFALVACPLLREMYYRARFTFKFEENIYVPINNEVCMSMDHTFIVHMPLEKNSGYNMDKSLPENEWNHAKAMVKFTNMKGEQMSRSS